MIQTTDKTKNASISVKIIQKIINAAIQAPTPDNCQPYTYLWNNGKLDIFHNTKLSDFAPDPNRRFSVLCLGIAAEAIDLACSSENLRPEFIYSIYSPDNKPWCTIQFQEEQRTINPLYSVISKRCSDRRAFNGGKLDGQKLVDFNNDALGFDKTNLYFTDKCPENLKKYLHEAYGLAFYWRKFRGDLLRLWHISYKKAQKTKIGLTYRALNLPRGALIIAWILHNTFGIGNKIFPFLHNSLPEIEYKDGAGLGCITVNSRDPEALIEAGRLCMRNWLRMNHIGFGYGPLGIVMHNYLLETGSLGSSIPKRFIEITSKGTEVLRQVFQIPDGEIPLWMFRTGLIHEELPEDARTFRLPLHAVSNLK